MDKDGNSNYPHNVDCFMIHLCKSAVWNPIVSTGCSPVRFYEHQLGIWQKYNISCPDVVFSQWAHVYMLDNRRTKSITVLFPLTEVNTLWGIFTSQKAKHCEPWRKGIILQMEIIGGPNNCCFLRICMLFYLFLIYLSLCFWLVK